MRKGEQTRTLILNEAVALASQVGLEGLSIGSLAGRLDMSKSGLFAHFGSKEDLQVRTLRRAQELFLEQVVSPALKQAQGLPRLRNLFSNWLAWLESNDDLPGGCLMLAASVEYDDRPGAVRDLLVAGQRELRGAIAKAIELFGVVLAAHHDLRLLGDPRALERAGDALERLIEAHRAAELSVLRART